MSENARPIVIRRRRKVIVHGHGGSWKIALADFMTALMALFLVLWILSSASPQELKSVAEYFRTPLSVALAGGDRSMSSTSVIPGGGADPTHVDGERQRTEMRMSTRATDIQRQFIDLQRRIETAIQADPELRDLRGQMRFDMTPTACVSSWWIPTSGPCSRPAVIRWRCTCETCCTYWLRC
ncbi:flagellar motor protein MotB [Kineobactrum salinum]|uniref:flagellar motor protein MotB n=1 Tax=Kineobactrum salinum TaxID=2708301 RepID=UPI0018D6C0EA|nr:flagellar motor protein MotB [Kineobactrum salinum]